MASIAQTLALPLVAFSMLGTLQGAIAQTSKEQKAEYQELVRQLISYRKLSHCGLVSIFEPKRGLPSIDIKSARDVASRRLMNSIESYIEHYSLKPGSAAIQTRFRHDVYLNISASADAELQGFVRSETKTNGCKDVLTRAKD